MVDIALDLDGTLAQTYDVAFKLMGVEDSYEYEDIDSWSWGFEEFGKTRYLNAIWHAWTIRTWEIEPMESDIALKTTALAEEAETLDVVTADPGHLGIKDAKREWLDAHGVYYDNVTIAPMKESKAELDYDVFVDDNPSLPENVSDDQRVLLYDAPYNREVRGCPRVHNLDEVIGELAHGFEVMA